MMLSPELAQAILNYLATKPYGEVFQLISAMQSEAAKAQTPTVEEPKE